MLKLNMSKSTFFEGSGSLLAQISHSITFYSHSLPNPIGYSYFFALPDPH